MSSYILPNLPGLNVTPQRSLNYATVTQQSVSGKQIRTAMRSSDIDGFTLTFNFLRMGAAAPNEAGLWPVGNDWSSYNEVSCLQTIFAGCKGTWDSFKIRDPQGGALVTVHFKSDTLGLTQIIPGVWQGKIDVESVL